MWDVKSLQGSRDTDTGQLFFSFAVTAAEELFGKNWVSIFMIVTLGNRSTESVQPWETEKENNT